MLKSKALPWGIVGALVLCLIVCFIWLGQSDVTMTVNGDTIINNTTNETSAASKSDEVVVTVNGDKITKEELYQSLVDTAGDDAVQHLIEKSLLEQAMKDKGLTYTQKELDDEYNSVRKNFDSDEAFAQMLSQYNLTEAIFKDEMLSQVQLKKLLSDQIKVTDEDVSSYYTENKDSFKEPKQYKVSQIVVADEAGANKIIDELKDGKDFATIAKEKSTDSATKDSGGEIGYVYAGQLEEALETAAFKLKAGEYTAPIKSDDGYYILKVSDIKEEHLPSFDEVKVDIKEQLVYQELSDLSSTYLADLKTRAKIENTLKK
jgi:foldase protein PrsA